MNANLSPGRAEQIRHLFEKVIDLPAHERSAFLDAAFRDNPALRRELTSLLDDPGELAHFEPLAGNVIEPLRKALFVGSEDLAGPDDLAAPHDLPAPDELIGRQVSHYQVVERLGAGGMGVVYKALDTRLDRTVALKFLPPDLTRDPSAKARFVHEAKAASALDHTNICTIYEIGETAEGQLYIAMACYAGETLKAKIDRGPLPVKEALDYAVQLSDGLSRAHAAGIVHRDVKPANVMVTERGRVKIVDFGLSKAADRTKLTQTGTTMGTAAYMSPEQARGEAVGAQTDVWSLGVVLYEMLTGRLPFRGEFFHAVIYSILNDAPEPIRRVNPEVPPELEQIVDRALQKEPSARYASAADVLNDLRSFQDSLRGTGAYDLRTVLRRIRRPRIAVPAAGVVLLLVLASIWFFDRQAKIQWAREVALPEIERLVEASWRDYTEAYKLAEQAQRYIPNDPKLAAMMARSSLHININTEPPGADVYMKLYDEPEREWQHVGVSPIDSLRVPMGVLRWKMEKDGYETLLAAASTWGNLAPVGGEDLFLPTDLVRVLDRKGSLPTGMSRVSGAETPYGKLDDFFIDQHEVTNEEYKTFVDAGGYRVRDHWRHEFIREGRVLSWEEAMTAFVDQTGRAGPATWQAGDYPEGEKDHPVSGISWYEAAAYAEFVGKSLPTGPHWGLARGESTPMVRSPQLGGFAIFSRFSNFQGDGPTPVGSLRGITPYGAYDMAGNVREWCWNETPEGRLIRGGAWNDHNLFGNLSQASAFDRSITNGFRCALYPHPEKIPASVFEIVEPRKPKDFSRHEHVSEAVFEVYKEQFSYDSSDLNPRLDSRNERGEDWIHERISFDAAYGNERMFAHLFLPKNIAPPYQTVIYFPGSGSLFQTSSDEIEQYLEFPVFLSFLIKNGRAVLYPVYKGTFERQDMDAARVHIGDNSYLYTDYLIKWVKDFSRSIYYLETRQDINSEKLAYYGMSWGGLLGAIIPAVEDRLQASILAPGGLVDRGRPEANQLNYIKRVKVPTLMLNGRFDTIAGVENAIRPMFDLLGTPDEHKALKLYDTDHIPPRNELIKEILAWLDRYLGAVQ